MKWWQRIFKKEKEIPLNKPYSKIQSFWLDIETIQKIDEYCKNKKITKGDFYRKIIKKKIK